MKKSGVVQKKIAFFAISIAIIILGIVTYFTMGINYSVEFAGGIELTASFSYKDDAEYTKIVNSVSKELKFLKLNTSEGQKLENGAVFTYPNKINNKTADSQAMEYLNRLLTNSLGEDRQAAESALKSFLGADFDFNAYKGAAENISGHKIAIETRLLSASLDKNILVKALIAACVAVVAVTVYFTIRFWKVGKFAAAFAALITFVHDMLILFSFVLVSGWIFNLQISGTFVAAMGAVLLFSVINLSVVFAKIRETSLNEEDLSTEQIVNKSVRRTCKRTLSSAALLLVILVILTILSASAVRFFTLPIIVGVIVSVYSSICIGSPLWATFGAMSKNVKPRVKSVPAKEA